MRVALASLRPIDAVTVQEQGAIYPVTDGHITVRCVAVGLGSWLIVENFVPKLKGIVTIGKSTSVSTE